MSLWRRISASTNLSPEGEQYVVVYAGNTGTTDLDLNLIAYPFDSVNGFGDRIVPTQFIEDGFNGGGRVAFSPSGGGVATTAGLFIPAPVNDFGLVSYVWDEGFGSRITTPDAKPRGAQNVAFHPDGDVVFVSHAQGTAQGGSELYAYNWSDATGFGSTRSVSSQIQNPYQDFQPIAVSPNGQFVAVGHTSGINLDIFPFSKSTGFGTKVQPSVVAAPNAVFSVAWNNAGTYVAIGGGSTDGTKRLNIWAWDNATGSFGAKVANTNISVGFVSTSTVYSIIFSPDDEAIILGVAAGPDAGLAAFSWDNDTGTFGAQYDEPSEPVPYLDYPRSLRFNTNGNVLFASGGDAAQSPVMAYQWDNQTGFGSRYDDPDSTGIGLGYNAYSIDYKDFG